MKSNVSASSVKQNRTAAWSFRSRSNLILLAFSTSLSVFSVLTFTSSTAVVHFGLYSVPVVLALLAPDGNVGLLNTCAIV
jgi:hypothetical protein